MILQILKDFLQIAKNVSLFIEAGNNNGYFFCVHKVFTGTIKINYLMPLPLPIRLAFGAMADIL
jgi:hypothetical protein